MSSSRRCEAGHVFGFRAPAWRPNVIQSYASAAKDGGSYITIVVSDVTLMRHVIEAIGAAGRRHVTLDFAGSP
jgi:hypothetical protein